MSIDGRISTGEGDIRDFDKDLPSIGGVSAGLHQYYELEQQTDLCSLNSGKVLQKIGINKPQQIEKIPVDFVVIDNAPHLTEEGVKNMLEKGSRLFIVTNNRNHPAFSFQNTKTLHIFYQESKVDFGDIFSRLKNDFGIDRVTIQTGGELNSYFLRNNYIDALSIVIAPCLIGGTNTPSLIDGRSLLEDNELSSIKSFRIKKITKLEDSYIHLQYEKATE